MAFTKLLKLVSGKLKQHDTTDDIQFANGTFSSINDSGASSYIEKALTVGSTPGNPATLIEAGLSVDSEFMTDTTLLAALILETNWILEVYSGTTIGAVEGQEYVGIKYRYLYQNSLFTRYPISTDANIYWITTTTAASIALNTTNTLISTGAKIDANTLVAGSTFDIHIFGTCTSTNADANTFTGHIGTLNTIADAALFTVVFNSAGSGTAEPFTLTIRFTVRTIGATGTIYGHIQLIQNTNTGIYNAVILVGTLTSVSNFSSLVQNFLNISYISAAVTTTTTFQNVIIERVK